MKKLLLLLVILLPFCLQAEEALILDGYLNPEKVQQAKESLQQFAISPPQKLAIVLHAQSGALLPVLDLAKALYTFREEHKSQLVVFIDDEALGAAAIIPFLADELFITPNVAWGAISSGSVQEVPINVLQSRVQGLIKENNPNHDVMNTLCHGMIDPQAELAGEFNKNKGETLVVNQNILARLKLVKGVVSSRELANRFLPKEQKKETLEQKTVPVEIFDHIHFQDNVLPHVGYISLTDRQEAISQPTWIYITSALNYYKETKPAAIIFEINSPGGEVFAAERISDALKEIDTQFGIPVICYINNWAISAGAMLAYSCRYIVIAKDASMGAAEPITIGQSGAMETASEKVNSALRSDFANRAKFFGRNPYIAEAMVDKDIILVSRHGEIIKVDSEEQIRKGGLDPDIVFKPKGKLLTLNADQMMQNNVACAMLTPIKLDPLTLKEKESGKYSIAKSALHQLPFFQKIDKLQIDSYQMSWQTRFLSWLSSPAVSSLLFTIMLVAFYMELSSGGFGLAGAVALISLFLIMLSSFALEAVHWLEPILILFGLLLIGLELFFFPTLGILGIVGAIFLMMGMAGIMLPGIESVSYQGDAFNAAGEYVLSRLAWLSGSFLVALLIIAMLSRYMWPRFALFQRLVLSESQRSQAAIDGTLVHSTLTKLPALGVEATVTRALRPAGKIMVNDEEFDAISTGNFIQEGALVSVVRIEGAKVIVEEIYS